MGGKVGHIKHWATIWNIEQQFKTLSNNFGKSQPARTTEKEEKKVSTRTYSPHLPLPNVLFVHMTWFPKFRRKKRNLRGYLDILILFLFVYIFVFCAECVCVCVWRFFFPMYDECGAASSLSLSLSLQRRASASKSGFWVVAVGQCHELAIFTSTTERYGIYMCGNSNSRSLN